MTTGIITSIRSLSARVSGKTEWLFVEITTDDGRIGLGEATLFRRERQVQEAIARLAATLADGPADIRRMASLPSPATLPEAAARSALDLALHDLAAQEGEVPLHALLGGSRRSPIPIYANINRRTLDRSPAGFAASARLAVDAGYTALKIAPFDEVDPERLASDRAGRCLRPGLERIAATRQAIGPGRILMVDCHWRLDESAAAIVIDEAPGQNIHWIECPVPETPETLPAIARLRASANRKGIRLAGCEMAIGCEGFAPFIEAGAYDVMMPDVKYVGGMDEMRRVAELLDRHGVEISLHNPSGPIAHAASLHVSAAVGGTAHLELQFDETPLFDGLADGALPAVSFGVCGLPAGPGLGVGLRADLCSVVGRWPAGDRPMAGETGPDADDQRDPAG